MQGKWRPVWSHTLTEGGQREDGVSVWPSPNGKDALVILTVVTGGTGNREGYAGWLRLPEGWQAP